MSSILEALKKAEKESPKLDFTPEAAKGLDTRKAVSRRARGSRVVYRTVSSVALLVVLALAAWFAYENREHFKRRPPDRTAPAPQVQAPVNALPEVAVATPRFENTRELREAAPPPAPAVNGDRPIEEVIREAKPVRKEEPALEQPPKPLPEPQPEDAKYKLEAIVWAETPEGRFAVINGHIVRTGQSMEGLSVTSIDKDHVGVRSRGREWKLRFVAE